MLTRINKFIRPRPGHKLMIGKFSQYLDMIFKHIDQNIEYYTKIVIDPIPSNGIDLLNGLIIRADINYLLSRENDFDRFRKINKEYSDMYSSYLRQYPVKEKFFFKGKPIKTNEFILYTDNFNLLQTIPFGSDNWDDWSKLMPVRILFSNTFELSADNRSSTFKYFVMSPPEVVLSINVPLLLNMYTKYRLLNKDNKEEFVIRTDNYPFIYKTCIAPLLKDLAATWILNIINKIIEGKLEDPNFTFDTDLLVGIDRAYFISSGIKSAIHDLEVMIDRYIHREMEPTTLIDSLMIYPNVSLTETINDVKDNNFIADSGQNMWLAFMKDYHYFKIIRNIYALRPGLNSSKNFFKFLRIIGKRYKNTRFWNHAKNPYIKMIIEERFNEIFEL